MSTSVEEAITAAVAATAGYQALNNAPIIICDNGQSGCTSESAVVTSNTVRILDIQSPKGHR